MKLRILFLPLIMAALVMVAVPALAQTPQAQMQWERVLAKHPELRRNPRLIFNADYMNAHPGVAEFVKDHPRIRTEVHDQGAWDNRGTWRNSDWWHRNDPDWMYENHPEWARNRSDWSNDGDWDDQRRWHNRDWWLSNHPDWVEKHHPLWVKRHEPGWNQGNQGYEENEGKHGHGHAYGHEKHDHDND